MKKWCMEKTNIGLFSFSLQFIRIIAEFVAKLLHDIGSSADTGSAIITMFGYPLTGSRDYETGKRRNIKSIFSVSPCSHDINEFISIQLCLNRKFKQSIPKSLKFFDGNTSHKKNRYKRSHFRLIVLTPRYIGQNFLCLFTRESFIFK